ncbi:MFS domain-containing protein [Trichostrongylus colubriformis]|uniref:MFS domain-containing protein n=1 Tax=Trichostrongylus colubriformis TaxID=6319 RepID=A0AAN8I8E9_TRICO
MAYQLLQMYSSQQTFLIFLQYTPPVGCFDGHCVKIRNRCYEPCPTCPDLCHNTTKANRDACIKKYNYYFYSPSMEYRVKCIDFYKSVSIAETQYLAVLIGNCFVGYIADKFGRRRMLLIALCAGIPFLVLSAVFDGVFAFYLFRFLLGLTIAGTMAVGWAYCAEMISPRHRFKLRTFTSWTNGRILMITFTFLGQSSWRLASYFNAAASLSTLAIIAFLPESPMWCKRKELYDRERESRKKMAWICGNEYVSDKETKKEPQPPTLSLLEMLRNPGLRTSFLTLSVMWFCAGLSMYAIDLNGEDMTENLWIGQFATAALASTIRVEGSTEVSKSSAETPVSKDTVPKDESKGESEVKEDIGSADKVESDAENRADDARSQSDEGEMYNKVTEGIPKPFKTTEEKTSEEEPKASKEEPKASREEPKVPKEEPKASKEEPKVSKEEPKASKEEPKVSKEEPKASKEEPQASKEGSKASMVESKEGPKQSQERVSGDK